MTQSEILIAKVREAANGTSDRYFASVVMVLVDAYQAAIQSALKMERIIHDLVKETE